MKTYVVQPGDTPASIASQPRMAGCPKCAIDLIRANPHKEAVRHPNGFVTFREMRVGEELKLPSKWFDGSLDTRSDLYFKALPHPDGVTPSSLGLAAASVLGDYAALDDAVASMSALSTMDDRAFAAAVEDAGALIGRAVTEAAGSTNQVAVGAAKDAQAGAYWAIQRAAEMRAELDRGDQGMASAARQETQNVLSAALDSARTALRSFYDQPQVDVQIGPVTVDTFPQNVVDTAKRAADAIAADAGYCSSVARAGSPVNSTVHAFKTAWNASQPNLVPINTGNYEQPTADAISKVLGSAPTACGARVAPAPAPAPVPERIVSVPQKKPLSTAAIAGLSLLGAGAAGGVAYLASRSPKRKRRR